MERRWSFRKVLSSVAVAGMLTSMAAVPTISPVNAAVDHQYDLVEMKKDSVLKNGNFDNGAANWNIAGQNSGVVAEDGVTIGKSGKLGATTDLHANGHIWQEVTLKPNTKYTLKAKVKFSSENSDDTITLDVKTGGLNAPKTFKDKPISPTNGWEEVELEFTTSSETAYVVGVARWVDGNASDSLKNSTVYFDDVELIGGDSEEDSNYDILWADDFNESQLDTSDWGYELGSIRGVEQQHYVKSDENVFMRDGNLVLKATDRAKEDQYKNPRGNRQVIYNSGSVRTHGKQEFLYGRIEMRAKLPKGRGAFPAFWTLGADFTLDGKINGKQGYGWSRCGEIDIMELLGGYEGEARNKQVWGTPHFYDKNIGDQWDQDTTGSGGKAYTNPSGADFNDDYHVFGINWSPDKIEWYVDGVIYNTLDLTNPTWGESAKKCFNRPQYIQLNFAMGGNWPGDVETNLAGTEFAIDYVYYAQNEEQKAAAKEYYDAAPEISGLKDVTMQEGATPDLLAGVTSNRNSFVDFSIENEHMFKNEGGLTSVDLLCTGKDDLASLAKLPVGKYNIHYTAIPNDIEYDGNRPERESDYKFTRKTMTLTVAERTFPSDFKLNGIVGDKLANVALPEGWSWVDPETKITGTADEYDVKYVNGEYSKTVKVVVNAVVVDKEGLKARLAEATAEAAKIDVYKAATIEKLNTVIEEATKVLNDTSANKEAVEEAIRALNTAIANLEKYVTEAELDQVIAEGEEFLGKTDIYTKESLDILSTALAKVRSAITSGDKEAIESAYAQLTEAIDKLVKIDAPTPEVKPEVKPENKPNTSVKTGDNTYLGAIMTSLLLSAGGLVLFKKRKYN